MAVREKLAEVKSVADLLDGVCKINCVYLHRLFDTPIFRTKKCFRQYCE